VAFSLFCIVTLEANAIPIKRRSIPAAPQAPHAAVSGDRDSDCASALHLFDCRPIVLSLVGDRQTAGCSARGIAYHLHGGHTPTPVKNGDTKKLMVNRVKRNYFIWALLSSPIVGGAYWLIAFSVVTVGCAPTIGELSSAQMK
jgi:hypothetical protein